MGEEREGRGVVEAKGSVCVMELFAYLLKVCRGRLVTVCAVRECKLSANIAAAGARNSCEREKVEQNVVRNGSEPKARR